MAKKKNKETLVVALAARASLMRLVALRLAVISSERMMEMRKETASALLVLQLILAVILLIANRCSSTD